MGLVAEVSAEPCPGLRAETRNGKHEKAALLSSASRSHALAQQICSSAAKDEERVLDFFQGHLRPEEKKVEQACLDALVRCTLAQSTAFTSSGCSTPLKLSNVINTDQACGALWVTGTPYEDTSARGGVSGSLAGMQVEVVSSSTPY